MKFARYKFLISAVICLFLCSFVNVVYAFPDSCEEGELEMFTLGTPTTIMSLSRTPSYDNIELGPCTIVQVDKSLYYLYYLCNGTYSDVNSLYAPARYKYWDETNNRYTTHDNRHIAFAYSLDGLNWIKGFPDGMSMKTNSSGNPLSISGDALPEGTNLLNYIGITEFDVVKVQDSDYPFRLIANELIDLDTYTNMTHVCMWKSKDGINFEDKVEILPDKYDSMPSVIARGNILKVYHRMRSQSTNKKRVIGVMYLDLNGAILSPLTTIIDDYYYNSAASVLDDRREILFPTYFDQKDPTLTHYDAYIVEGYNYVKCNSSTSAFMFKNDRFGMTSPHIIDINGKNYILYYQSNKWHSSPSVKIDQSDTGKKTNEYRLIPIKFDVVGNPCPASLRK